MPSDNDKYRDCNFSPSTTCKLQPCDGGILAVLNFRNRILYIEKARYLSTEESWSNIYKVDILTAMLAVQWICGLLPISVIDSWQPHTNITSGVASSIFQDVDWKQPIQNAINGLVPAHARIGIHELFRPMREEDCTKEVRMNFTSTEYSASSTWRITVMMRKSCNAHHLRNKKLSLHFVSGFVIQMISPHCS